MEPVSSESGIVHRPRNRIHRGEPTKCVMKRSVETCDLRQGGPVGQHVTDRLQVLRLMQGSPGYQARQVFEQCRVHTFRAGMGAAMHNSMPNRYQGLAAQMALGEVDYLRHCFALPTLIGDCCTIRVRRDEVDSISRLLCGRSKAQPQSRCRLEYRRLD